jgi:hypothetical protein
LGSRWPEPVAAEEMPSSSLTTLPILLAAPALEQLLVDPQRQRRVGVPTYAIT